MTQKKNSKSAPKRKIYPAGGPLKLVLIYAVFSCLWILLSDKAAALLFNDPAKIILAGTIKGWLFIGVTSLLLYGLISRLLNQARTAYLSAFDAQSDNAQAKQLLDNIANSSSDAIFAKDLEGRYLLINRETSRVLGTSTEQALGRDDTELFPPEQAASIRARDLQIIKKNKISTYEETVSNADGERTLLITKGPLRNEDGDVIGLFGVSRDITERKRVEISALEERDFIHAVLDSLPGIFYLISQPGQFLLWNKNFEKISGYCGDEISKMSPLDFFEKAEHERIAGEISRVYEHGETITDAAFLTKDRTLLPFLFHGKRYLLENKFCLMGMGIDIAERKKVEKALQESQKQFKKIVEYSPIAMALSGANGTINYINRKAVETFGYQHEDIPDLDSWWVQAYPDEAYRAKVMAQWTGRVEAALVNKNEIEPAEYYVTGKDGRVKLASIFGVWVGAQVLVIFDDITDRKEAEEKIRSLAYFDPLTKLPNRRLMMDRLSQSLIASNRTEEFGALLILDLDNFKELNDTKGHDAGDQLLIEVAHRIVASVRLVDTISRLGGDEYVVMVEGLGKDETSAASEAEMIAETIRVALSQPYGLYGSGTLHHSTTSIGVALFLGNELSVDALLKHADMALYQAKGAGRNTVRFFNPAMQAAVESRSRMEAALRKGIQCGEFELFYQPQINHEGRLIGAEALLRWMSAEHGSISPENFIPLAEDTGLIVPLGLWVLQTACAQLKLWSENPRSRGLQISVNVSARQFRQENFVEQVVDVLNQSGANPALLKLELTESVVLDNVEDVILRMRKIRALGVTFSLDDFGTGFSSLSYLKRLPLNEVKIDQSFVRDISSDPNDAAIVRAIIAMSHSLGIEVIAEGVETEAQLHFLKKNGCTKFQGYFFGKPAAIGDWARFLPPE
jgi:diguanylate cyclase (GGDEF)-like protein/PAS domain S-box-containing protein